MAQSKEQPPHQPPTRGGAFVRHRWRPEGRSEQQADADPIWNLPLVGSSAASPPLQWYLGRDTGEGGPTWEVSIWADAVPICLACVGCAKLTVGTVAAGPASQCARCPPPACIERRTPTGIIGMPTCCSVGLSCVWAPVAADRSRRGAEGTAAETKKKLPKRHKTEARKRKTPHQTKEG